MFPILEDYERDWPTHDCLMTHLKNRRTRKSRRSPGGDESPLTEPSEDDGRKAPKKTKRKVVVVSREKREKKIHADGRK